MISTIIVRYKLVAESHRFEEWKTKMDAQSRQANGFLDRTDLPITPNEPYHSVILRFDKKANAQKWLLSDKRKKLLEELKEIAVERREMLHDYDTFWFEVSGKKNGKKWKQVIVSLIAVYPLTQVIPILVQPLLKHFNISSTILNGLLVGFLISTCMVYFAMPLVLKLFKAWLRPD